MLTKRIIPCLDIRKGMTVKGVNFVKLKKVGDPVELAEIYAKQGADELVLLDINASIEGRDIFLNLVDRIANHINIPFTVGGGISELRYAETLLKMGANKISVNSAAVRNPQLINDLSEKLGSKHIVLAIDAKKNDIKNNWLVTISGGKVITDKELFTWAKEAEDRGAGEILFTSMDNDGVKEGFANDALAELNNILSIPVIASGGAGTMEHFKDAFTKGKADAALAASVFHFNEISIPKLKEYLRNEGIRVK